MGLLSSSKIQTAHDPEQRVHSFTCREHGSILLSLYFIKCSAFCDTICCYRIESLNTDRRKRIAVQTAAVKFRGSNVERRTDGQGKHGRWSFDIADKLNAGFMECQTTQSNVILLAVTIGHSHTLPN